MIKFTGNSGDFNSIGLAAAGRGNVEAVREILKARPKWLNRVGPHGRTMIWEAAHRGKLPMVKYLVRRKADIDSCGTYYTPYFVEVSCYCIARHKKRHEVADFLLAKGAKLNIHTAAFLSDIDGVTGFLKKKKSLINQGHPQQQMVKNHPDGLDYVSAPAAWATPLCYALRGGDTEMVELLIEKGAKVKGNEQALYDAVDDDHNVCAKFRLLLENGADPKLIPQVLPDEGELFDLVTSYGVAPSKADSEEFVYLCRGDRGGNPKDVQRLLDLGAEINYQDAKGKSALHRATKAGFVETVKVLLKNGAGLEVKDNKGETPLFEVFRSTIKDDTKIKKTLKLLLKSGAKKSTTNNKGLTPLGLGNKSKMPIAKELIKILKQSR